MGQLVFWSDCCGFIGSRFILSSSKAKGSEFVPRRFVLRVLFFILILGERMHAQPLNCQEAQYVQR